MVYNGHQERKMKKAVIFCIIFAVVASFAFAAPFGIEFGWFLTDLEANGIRYYDYSDEHFVALIPPFEYWLLSYYFADYNQDGIYCVSAATNDLTSGPDGDVLWSNYNQIIKDFYAFYGMPNMIVDYYSTPELKKPANFMVGLANDAIKISTIWFVDDYAITLNLLAYDEKTGIVSCEVTRYRDSITYFNDLKSTYGAFFPVTKDDIPW